MRDFLIAPSLLAANFAELGTEAKVVLAGGADMLHIDVMDNHYVPNLTMGPLVCDALRRFGITAPLDVHLMARPVDRLIVDFAKAGATYITIHPESSDHLDRSLELIRKEGCKAGIALNPATPLQWLDHILPRLDLILIMSVNPGFGGQQFIVSMLDKIKKTRAIINGSNLPIRLSVDGGINGNNITAIGSAGADTFVAGSSIFSTTNYKTAILEMRQALANIP
jgi:ribulose-phosphate 3-epimerase